MHRTAEGSNHNGNMEGDIFPRRGSYFDIFPRKCKTSKITIPENVKYQKFLCIKLLFKCKLSKTDSQSHFGTFFRKSRPYFRGGGDPTHNPNPQLNLTPWYFVYQQFSHYSIPLVCVVHAGNLLMFLVIAFHARMRTITNFFLANLAVTDLCVGIFCVLPNLSSYLWPEWILGRVS